MTNHAPKIMIRSDMEGLTGVVSYDQVIPGRAEYGYGQSMLMADLLALIEGLQSGGCGQIVIYDEHFEGRNIDVGLLPRGVNAICGKPPYRSDWAGGLDGSFAGVILLGLHSRSGTTNGLLNHTYEHDIAELVLNDIALGEIGMEAAIAGDFGVPLWVVVGDSAAIAETQALLKGAVGVVVKESVSPTGAVCYPLAETTENIRETAQRLVTTPPAAEPFRVGKEAHLRVSLKPGAFLSTFQNFFGNRMVDDHTVILEGKRALDVWAEYWQMKLACYSAPGCSAHSDLEHQVPAQLRRHASTVARRKEKATR